MKFELLNRLFELLRRAANELLFGGWDGMGW